MAMNVTGAYANEAVYGSNAAQSKADGAAVAETGRATGTSAQSKADGAAVAETSKATAAGTSAQKNADEGVVYEKSTGTEKKATYSVNRMSASDRAALVKRLEADQESRKQSLVNIAQTMMGKQAGAFATANGDDSMWKALAGGNFKVDAATRAQAQKDIGEDGYWGVKQTSQRLFDFASALAGDNVDKMKEMQTAMEKGFKLATKSWGNKLPGICHDTLKAANQMFEDYYNAKTSSAAQSENL